MRSIDRYFVGFLAPGAATAKGRGIAIGKLLAGAVSGAALLAAAAPAMAAGSAVEPLRVSAAATDKVPAKVASGALRIAVVRQLSAGDYYQQWIAGARSEAERLKVKLEVYDANGDNAREAVLLQQAVATKPDAIVVDSGVAAPLKAGLDAARNSGIPLVAYYVDHIEGSSEVAVIEQDDRSMMEGILDRLTTDLGGSEPKAEMIYVYAPGYQSLDARDAVWQAFVKRNPEIRTVATFGVVNPDTVAQVAGLTKAALAANHNVKAVMAPWDEFAMGATRGIEEAGLQDKIKVYGIDISKADIAAMTRTGSPWVITAATDASNVGSVVVRAAVLKAVGQTEGDFLSLAPVLVSQEALRSKQVQTMDQLKDAFPALETPELLRAPWMHGMK
ncbi:MAG: substrate-binding domain-containing protein [Geminicoccaceae bacterium]